MKLRITLAMSAAALALAALPAAAANLISNGSFEVAPLGQDTILGPDDGTIAPWITRGQGVEWVSNGNNNLGVAHDGTSWVDLAWFTSDGTPGGAIDQTFSTVAGQTYSLQFFGTTESSFGRDGTGVVNALINGNLLQSFNLTRASATPVTFSDWKPFSTSFVATANSTTLRLSNTQNAFQHFAFIDSVSVTAVPEPASWALMIVGFGLLGSTLRQARRLRPVACRID